MSIHGIGGPSNVGGAAGYSPLAPRPQAPDLGRSGEAKRVSPVADQAAAWPAERALSAETPAGIDPALWSVLSTEERQFFNKLTAMGPLTYGPRSANVPPGMVRGGRIDRVV